MTRTDHPNKSTMKPKLLLISLALGGLVPAAISQPIPESLLSKNQPLPLASADTAGSSAGKSEESAEELAKAAQNPVAKLISVPFQNNFNFGIGPNNICQYVLNVQPVIPISLNEDWNLITRTIMPIIN